MTLLAILVVVVLTTGYLTYGRFIARQYRLDDAKKTPAVEREDGEDFVPTPRFYLLGQHFSAIAAAGPIAGPIMACQVFGWAPSLIWIGLGVVFIGAVHDFSALVASVRHRASSIAELVREHVGTRAWIAIMVFIWLALIYVLVAFVDVTASTFLGAATDLPDGTTFHPGGAVAGASTMYLGLALAMGLVQRFAPKVPLAVLTAIFVPATLLVVWLGTKVSGAFVLDRTAWSMIILAYSLIASLLPMWLLLQPRGYLGGFVLYLALGAGVIGIFFLDVPIAQPAFKGFTHPELATGALFPFLFVTIACGACSGFHGLVCSGTTSKQIAKESDCAPVGYGAMLLEGLVAVIALATVMAVAPEEIAGRSPGRIYGDGLGRFVAAIIGEQHLVFASTFGAMAFSTFVFDTIDVAVRLGRYILEELFKLKGRALSVTAAFVTVLPPAILLLTTKSVPGQPPAYMKFWTLFGTSNQLLAALTLMAVAVWLYREGRRVWFVVVPMIFVLAVTVTALVMQIVAVDDLVLRVTACALLALAIYVSAACAKAVRGRGSSTATATSA